MDRMRSLKTVMFDHGIKNVIERIAMPTDTKLRNLKPKDKLYKVNDRDGLYVAVMNRPGIADLVLPPIRRALFGLFAGYSLSFSFATTAIAYNDIDTLLINGKILTVDEDFSVVEALAIENGRIIAIGDDKTISALKGFSTKVIDLEGRTVTPGMIDTTLHFVRGAQTWHQQARLDGVRTRQEALDIIAGKASSVESGAWITIEGAWERAQFSDQPGGFTLAELDAAAPDNPFIATTVEAGDGLEEGERQSLTAYLNSKALAAVGMTPADGARHRAFELVSAPLPPEGKKTTSFNRQRPGPGKSQEAQSEQVPLMVAVAYQLPEVSQEQWLKNVSEVARKLAESGLTSVYFDGAEVKPPLTDVSLNRLIMKRQLPVRAWHSLRLTAFDEESAKVDIENLRQNTPLSNNEWGGLIGIGEAVYWPFSDHPGTTEPFSEEIMLALTRQLKEAARNGYPTYWQHALSNVAVTQTLAAIDKVNEETPIAPLRWAVGHVNQFSIENIQHAKRLGVSAAVQANAMRPPHALIDTPLKAIQDSGIRWGLGTDGTFVSPYQPFLSLGWAVSGRNMAGKKMLSQTVSREQALIAQTRTNAWLLLQEDKVGSLEVGKLADLVVLDRDYMKIPAFEIYDIKPIMTMVDGKVVFDAGILGK